jgi:2-isopropylmalate synthase
VIRVNSQSGKGGVAHLLRAHHGLDLPKALRAEFSRVVQDATDRSGREVTPKDLLDLFRAAYAAEGGPVTLASWTADGGGFRCVLRRGEAAYEASGAEPVDAVAAALSAAGIRVEVLERDGHAVEGGAVAYARCRVAGASVWGAGEDAGAGTAYARAVLAAVNRALRE